MGRMLEPFVLGGRRQTMIDEAVERALATIKLTARRNEPVGNLSAAHQQRVSLGVAMLWSPDVLLLDDPLAHADDAWAREAWELFRTLAGRGHTVVVATGKAREALNADQVALIRAGRLLDAGATAALAPPGKAKIAFKYIQKTGPIAEEVEVQDLTTELPGLMERKPGVKPVEVRIQQDSPETRLEALLDAQ
jgi:ABC-type multidrug transport system ATPase subunit